MKLLKDKVKFYFQTILTELDYTGRLSLSYWAYIRKHGTKKRYKILHRNIKLRDTAFIFLEPIQVKPEKSE